MNDYDERGNHVSQIDNLIRQLTWQCHKHMLHTLSRPEIGLTMPQTMTLFAIRAAHSCRMSELADATNQSAGTLTGIVDRLIDENLVGRVRDVDDRRVVQVMLTSEGERRLAMVEQILHEDMEDRLTLISGDQLRLFHAVLHSLVASYQNELLNGHRQAVAMSAQIA